MPLFNMTIRLMDTGLPFDDLESAKQAAEEWAKDVATIENCTVVDVEVVEDG